MVNLIKKDSNKRIYIYEITGNPQKINETINFFYQVSLYIYASIFFIIIIFKILDRFKPRLELLIIILLFIIPILLWVIVGKFLNIVYKPIIKTKNFQIKNIIIEKIYGIQSRGNNTYTNSFYILGDDNLKFRVSDEMILATNKGDEVEVSYYNNFNVFKLEVTKSKELILPLNKDELEYIQVIKRYDKYMGINY